MKRVVPLGFVLPALLAHEASAQSNPPPSQAAALAGSPDLIPIYILLLSLIVLTAVLIIYVWGLRDKMSNAMAAGNVDGSARATLLTAYNDLPLGVPRGSVRAVLAMIIVFGSIAFLALSMMTGGQYKFPEALTGILGAILGFYFGKGGAGEDGQAVQAVAAANADTRDALAKANDATTQAKDAQAKVDSTTQMLTDTTQTLTDVQTKHDELAKDRLDGITSKLQDAVGVGNAIGNLLPGSFGAAVKEATGTLGGTLNAVNDLRHGDLAGAVQQASTLLDKAAPNMPVVSVLAKAAQLIGPVLGGAFPPIALITTLVGVGSKLSAIAYARWVARIMDQPYTPEQFSPTVFDSNAAVSLIMQVPALAKALGPQLQAGARDVALDVVRLALAPDGGAALLAKYPEAFAGLDQASIDGIVRDLQKASLDYVLAKDLPPDAGAAIGGTTAMLQGIDKIRANHDASAGLDAVMTAVTALKRSGKNPETEFNEAAKSLADAKVPS